MLEFKIHTLKFYGTCEGALLILTQIFFFANDFEQIPILNFLNRKKLGVNLKKMKQMKTE